MTTPTTADAERRKRAIAELFGRGADSYDQVGVDFFSPVGRDLVAAADLRSGERVLDVGCGRGAVTFAAADAVGAEGHVVATDLSEQMVDLLRAETQARGLTQVAVSVDDAESPDFGAGSFDAILAGLVIFFLPDPVAGLANYARLLRADGRLAFSTFGRQDPNFEAAMRELGKFIPGEPPARDRRQGAFATVDGTAELLDRSRFTVADVQTRSYVSRFADPDHWLAWVWSHGGRATLEQLPRARLDEACTAAKSVFEAAKTAAGDYSIETEFRLTIARPQHA